MEMSLVIGETAENELNVIGEQHPYANYIIDTFNGYHKLKIPDYVLSGVKLIHSFEIVHGETTELILDFNIMKSIVRGGHSGTYTLKPVIKVLDLADIAEVGGTVTDDEGASFEMEKALVTAQTYDISAAGEQDQVVVESSTISDEEGAFKMYLEPGTYYLVAYKEGFNPGCAKISVDADTVHTQNIALSRASMGTVTVDIDGTDEDKEVVLSFRRQGICEENIQIEVTSLNLEGGGDFTVSLPAGQYRVVASTDTSTLSEDVEVVAGEDTYLVIEFPVALDPINQG